MGFGLAKFTVQKKGGVLELVSDLGKVVHAEKTQTNASDTDDDWTRNNIAPSAKSVTTYKVLGKI